MNYLTLIEKIWKNRFFALKIYLTRIWKNLKNLFFVLGKTVVWFIPTMIIGLSPIIIAFGLSHLIPPKITLQKIMMDGALLFFSVTIISTLFTDYCLSEKIPKITSLRGLFFFGIPTIIIIICISLFMATYQRTIQHIDLDVLIGIQLTILAVSFLYTFYIKFDMFRIQQQTILKVSSLNNSKMMNLITRL